MPTDKLTPLQRRLLAVLAEASPRWTLTGGGALAGFHTHERPTRDLDLFFRALDRLDDQPTTIARQLRDAGFDVRSLQTSTTFHRLSVSDGEDTTILDLVAEPADPLEPALQLPSGRVAIPVETPHEILVRKLCALLSRSEPRDLADVRALLRIGESLERAVADAPKRDGGFSPLTLAWVLRNFPVASLARALGSGETEATELERFRDELIDRLTPQDAYS